MPIPSYIVDPKLPLFVHLCALLAFLLQSFATCHPVVNLHFYEPSACTPYRTPPSTRSTNFNILRASTSNFLALNNTLPARDEHFMIIVDLSAKNVLLSPEALLESP